MDFCADNELGYVGQRTVFSPTQAFVLDPQYRLAHLPLVAPTHPKVIATRSGTPYVMGRHEPVLSLVLPVPSILYDAPAFLALARELRAAPFAAKIAWHVLEPRRSRLHATLCGSLARGERLGAADASRRASLVRLGPLSIELRGLFSGSLNHGRLYLKAYPERRGGGNVLAHIQRAWGAPSNGRWPRPESSQGPYRSSRRPSSGARLIGGRSFRRFLRLKQDRRVPTATTSCRL